MKKTIRFATLASLTCFVSANLTWADGGSQHRVRQARPISLGTSGGSINDIDGFYCCGGTLGSLVRNSGGTRYILSNNHVLGRTNRAASGEDTVQPGLIEVGCAQFTGDVVADFTQYITLQWGNNTNNLVDAAIAQERAGLVTSSILDVGGLSSSTLSATVGLGVKKSGRTTGLTTGSVSAVNVTVLVGYPRRCGSFSTRTARFIDQFSVTSGSSFSAGGDSGSLIVENVGSNPRAVGLLFAGSSSSTIGNRIQNVLSAAWSTGTLSMVGGGALTDTPETGVDGENLDDGGDIDPLRADAGAGKGGFRPLQADLIAEAAAVKAQHENELFRISSEVVGTGVSLDEQGGAIIEVYLAKSPRDVLGALPGELDGIPVRIIETGRFEAY